MLYALSKSISIRSGWRDKKDLTTNWSLVVTEFKYERRNNARRRRDCPRTRWLAAATTVHTNFDFPSTLLGIFRLPRWRGKIIIRNQVRKLKSRERIDDTRLTIKIVKHSFFLFSPEKIPSPHFKFHERESWSSSILLHYILPRLRLCFFLPLACAPEEEEEGSSAGKLS